jgi:thioredoxin reductase (NADPH)
MLLLDKKITEELYDICILGGGVAGLAAAITAGQLGLRTLIMEKAVYGGSVAVLETVTGMPGIEEVGGWEFTQTMVKQAETVGCRMLDSIEVNGVQKQENNRFEIQCSDGNRFQSRAVIITTGGQPKLLGLEDEPRFAQRGIHTCAQCAGARYSGRDVGIAGNGNWAVQAAQHLLNLGCKVVFVSGDTEMTGNAYLVDKILNHEQFHFMAGHHVVKLSGGEYLDKIEVMDVITSELKLLDVAAVFVYRGVIPDIKNIDAKQDTKGFFMVDGNFMTSLPGIFATGRVVYEDLPVQVLVGDGSRAALSAAAWLQAA